MGAFEVEGEINGAMSCEADIATVEQRPSLD
jgi:hypothetical protein